MRKISTISFAVATLALFTLSSAQAAVVSIAGDVGDVAGSTSGQLHILVDVAPDNFSFSNGGLSLSVSTSQAGVIKFTDAEVDNRTIFGSDIWSLAGVQGLSDDKIDDLFAASVSTQGLNKDLPGNPVDVGGSVLLFATINYDVIGDGATDVNVEISQRVDPVFHNGADVSSSLTFMGANIAAGVVPEPTSLILAGLGLIGFVGTRRRS